jgi:hypothetical protein
VRPITISDVYHTEQGGGFGRWLLGLAMIAGLAVTLYRNDVVRNLAHSAQLDGVYSKLEQALGGPSFGTPRSIDRFSAAAALTVPESSSPVHADAAPGEAVKTSVEPPKLEPPKSSAPTESSPAVVSLDSLPVEKAGAAAPASAAPAAAVEKSLVSAVKASAPVEKAEPEKPKSLKDAIRAAANGPSKAAAPAKKRKRGASDFDPLNPNL